LSFVSPVSGPAVVAEPVRKSSFNSPSNDLDAMSSEVSSVLVLVDSRLVAKEVFVDAEASFDGSVLHDFALDSSGFRGNVISLRKGVQLGAPALSVVALRKAVGSSNEVQARLLSRRASRDGVWVARGSNNSALGNEVPSAIGVSSFASIARSAGGLIHEGQNFVEGSI